MPPVPLVDHVKKHVGGIMLRKLAWQAFKIASTA
jgi:hypothetical protein